MAKRSGGLKKWFEQDWVDIGAPKKGGGFAKCGRSKLEKDRKRKYPEKARPWYAERRGNEKESTTRNAKRWDDQEESSTRYAEGWIDQESTTRYARRRRREKARCTQANQS